MPAHPSHPHTHIHSLSQALVGALQIDDPRLYYSPSCTAPPSCPPRHTHTEWQSIMDEEERGGLPLGRRREASPWHPDPAADGRLPPRKMKRRRRRPWASEQEQGQGQPQCRPRGQLSLVGFPLLVVVLLPMSILLLCSRPTTAATAPSNTAFLPSSSSSSSYTHNLPRSRGRIRHRHAPHTPSFSSPLYTSSSLTHVPLFSSSSTSAEPLPLATTQERGGGAAAATGGSEVLSPPSPSSFPSLQIHLSSPSPLAAAPVRPTTKKSTHTPKKKTPHQILLQYTRRLRECQVSKSRRLPRTKHIHI